MVNYIKEKLMSFVSSNVSFRVNNLSFCTPLISSGIIDSFGLVDLSLFIENEFDVEILDTELTASTFDNIEQLANLILMRQTQNQKGR